MALQASYENLVQELYLSYFGRPADPAGLANFSAELAAANAPTDLLDLSEDYGKNAAITSLINSFGTSKESATLYGPLDNATNATAFVNAVFENLFNRAPAAAGLSFWVNAITSGSLAPGNAALSIAAGAANNFTYQGNQDQEALYNKVTEAVYFTRDLNTPVAIASYSGASAAATARTLLAGITSSSSIYPHLGDLQLAVDNMTVDTADKVYKLTTGTDNFIGSSGSNVFYAVLDSRYTNDLPDATLNSGDSITGAGSANTLNIVDLSNLPDTGMANPAVSISGITTLNISSDTAVCDGPPPSYAPPKALDFSSWTTLKAVNVTASYEGVDIAVPDDATLNISGSGWYFGEENGIGITTYGGKTVTVDASVDIPNGRAAGTATIHGGSETSTVSVLSCNGTIEDLNYGSGHANTITTVNASDSSMTIDSDALTTLALTDVNGLDFVSAQVNAAAGSRTLTATLQGAVFGNIEDNTATTFKLVATDNASIGTVSANAALAINISDSSGLLLYGFSAADADTVTITGAGDFTSGKSVLATQAHINAVTSNGAITMNVDPGQIFLGGAGRDTITITGPSIGGITGGSATDNAIILNNAPDASLASFAGTKNFQVLGTSGTTSGTFDMAQAQQFKGFAVQGGNGDALAFINVAPGSSLSIDQLVSHDITYQTTDTTGATDSMAVDLGTVNTYGGAYTDKVTLEDKNGNGIGQIDLVSNAYEGYCGIEQLIDNDLSTVNLTGNASMSFESDLLTNAPTFTFANSAGSTPSTLGLDDYALTSLNFSGTEAITVRSLGSDTPNLTIDDSDSAAVTISQAALGSLNSLTVRNESSGQNALLTLAPSTEASLASLTLQGNVVANFSLDALSSGITVSGKTDNATVTFQSLGSTATGATDSAVLGDGTADSVTFGAGVTGSIQSITLGNGAGDAASSTSSGKVQIVLGNGSDAVYANGAGASITVTAGNGNNNISLSGNNENINLTLGSGNNAVTTGAGAGGSVVFAAHSGADTLAVGTLATGGTAPDISRLVTVTGLANAATDTISFAAAGSVTAETVRQVTSSEVTTSGGNTSVLADWIAAATGKNNVVAQAAGNIDWFQFGGNTYLVETAAAGDGGKISSSDAIVELTGTGYTFAHASASAGILHLLG